MLLNVLLALVGTAVVLALLVVGSFRFGFGPVLTGMRHLNRAVLNPRQLRTAGQPAAYASLVHHVGRVTGLPRATPVVAVPTDDGFAVALPYGTSADWVRNVLAAGRARIEHEGRETEVVLPRIRSEREVGGLFSAKERREHRVFGVREVLLVSAA